MPNRAILFVDGSNWYHGCKSIGVPRPGAIDFTKVSRKLVGWREWVATRYYVGQVPQSGNPALARDQRAFLERQRARDVRFSWHFGRIESRQVKNPAALELRRFLAGLTVQLDPSVYRELDRIARAQSRAVFMVEKAVDVQLALDMVILAERDIYDSAYLLSADGDLTPAVEFVRSGGRRVFAASAIWGTSLASTCNAFISLKKAWFSDVMTP